MTLTPKTKQIIIKTIKIGLILSTLYYLFSTYNWMVFEKYQIDGNIKGISEQVDKDLGLDKMNDKAYEYEKLWIDAEIKHCKTMILLSILTFIAITRLNKSEKTKE